MERLRRAGRSIANILRTHYAPFVFGLPLRKGEIPVFVYHDVEASQFARDLEFLGANSYKTLRLEEFLDSSSSERRTAGQGRRQANYKRVLLTFDDARRNFYDVALPQLRAFGAHASLFVPTYWMNSPARSTPAREQFMTWEQVKECAQSGLVDVQSHAHRHALVFTSDRLLGFASPEALARYDIYDWPMRQRNGSDVLGRPSPGTPIYTATPLLSARTRFLESTALAEACTDLVSQSGEREFFARPDWSVKLQRLHSNLTGKFSGGYLTDEALVELMTSEFELARTHFQSQLGYEPRTLAYPWMLGSRQSLQLARKHGLRAAFGVALDYGRARDPQLPIPVFGRLKSDWLPLLPGAGRASLLSVAAKKVGALSKIQHLAH